MTFPAKALIIATSLTAITAASIGRRISEPARRTHSGQRPA